jgi:nucleotide-binding universal stress UspA family protein
MRFDRILIPTDGSEFTRRAIEKGISIAKLSSGTITAVHILDQAIYASMPMDSSVVDLYETMRAEGMAALDYVTERCHTEGVEVVAKLIEGSPAKVIIRMSADHDLVVMGTLGKRGMTKILLGSVAEKVLERAECPVMVINNAVSEADSC